MTATAFPNGARKRVGATPIDNAMSAELAASEAVANGQIVTLNASGYAVLNDGLTPNHHAAGVVDINATYTAARLGDPIPVHVGAEELPQSTAASDAFSALEAKQLGVAYIASENSLGKKESAGTGEKRSIFGLAYEYVASGTTAGSLKAMGGPIGQLLARLLYSVTMETLANHNIADGAASDTIAERAVSTRKRHAVVTGVEYVGGAIAADNTDYVTITISKRDGAGGSAVTVATYDSRAANQAAATAFVPKSFALSGTAANLNILTTDVLTITVAKGGSGKSIIGNVRVIGKVI